MRIIHRRSKKIDVKKLYSSNEGIKALRVLVLDEKGSNLGVMNTAEAVRLAREREFDLVEINPKIDPPVAKMVNYGQFQYQQEKAERLKKAHQRVTKTKCVRLSPRIGRHDLDIRREQTMEFLNSGDKVKLEIILRGREMRQAPFAFEVVKNFINEITALGPIKFDQELTRQGNSITAIVMKG